jgi:hypothetical protein
MNPVFKAFLASLLITIAAICLLIGLAFNHYGERTNFPFLLALGSCVGLTTLPLMKNYFKQRAN